jgi:hypothetical protein
MEECRGPSVRTIEIALGFRVHGLFKSQPPSTHEYTHTTAFKSARVSFRVTNRAFNAQLLYAKMKVKILRTAIEYIHLPKVFSQVLYQISHANMQIRFFSVIGTATRSRDFRTDQRVQTRRRPAITGDWVCCWPSCPLCHSDLRHAAEHTFEDLGHYVHSPCSNHIPQHMRRQIHPS